MPQQFTPDLINNLAFWFEPSRTGGAFKDAAKTTPCAADGDAIAVLADLSGDGYDAVQATAANQPAYKTAGLFSLPCARLNGTSSFLTLGAPAGLETLQYTGHTLTYVVAMSSLPTSTQNEIISKFLSGTDARFGHGFSLTGYPIRYSTATNTHSKAQVAAGQKVVITHRFTPICDVSGGTGNLGNQMTGREEWFVNGRKVSVNAGSFPAWNTAGWYLGCCGYNPGVAFLWGGDLAFLSLYGRDLTDLEVAQLHTYVSMRHGVSNRPYALNPANPPLRANIALVGDSLTAGFPNYLIGYSAQMQALAPWARVVNYGLSGISSPSFVSNAAGREDTMLDPSLQNIVIYWGGTNDIAAASGTGATTAYSNLQTYCAARRAAGHKVIVATIIARSTNLTGTATTATMETDRQTYNANVRANWATFADGLLDLGSGTAITIGGQSFAVQNIGAAGVSSSTTYFVDGTHLTGVGYFLVAQAAAAAAGVVSGVAFSGLLTAADNAAIAGLVTVRPGGTL